MTGTDGVDFLVLTPSPPTVYPLRYLVWKTITAGLGNQFVSMWGAFEYALLTNRALLVNTDTSIDK